MNYFEAKQKAYNKCKKIDACYETDKAWVFSSPQIREMIDDSSIVVSMDTGEIIPAVFSLDYDYIGEVDFQTGELK